MRPVSGPNLKPCPEKPAPMTTLGLSGWTSQNKVLSTRIGIKTGLPIEKPRNRRNKLLFDKYAKILNRVFWHLCGHIIGIVVNAADNMFGQLDPIAPKLRKTVITYIALAQKIAPNRKSPGLKFFPRPLKLEKPNRLARHCNARFQNRKQARYPGTSRHNKAFPFQNPPQKSPLEWDPG